MSFDFSTLITDRSQADLDALGSLLSVPMEDWTDEQLAEFNQAASKGAYNASDLNRVTACMEYLYGVFQGLGYAVPGYIAVSPTRSVQLTNIINNPSFETSDAWTGVVYDTTKALYGTRSSVFNGTTINQQNTITPVIGHKYYGRTSFTSSGEINAPDNRFELFAGDGPGLNWVFARYIGNYPNWATLSSIQTIDSLSASSYIIRSFVVQAQSTVWTDGLMVIDLTESFGPGKEPGQSWCDTNIPFFSGSTTLTYRGSWEDTDVPTASQMAQYLSNVKALKDVITGAYTVSCPSSMALLTYVGANNIEQLLAEINAYLTALQAVFLRSGMTWAVSGGPGFYFSN